MAAKLKTSLSPADAIALIQSELQRKNIDEVPEGWMTAVDWAAKTNLSRVHIARVLKHGEENGLVESKMFRVKTGDVIRKTRHYKMKETK